MVQLPVGYSLDFFRQTIIYRSNDAEIHENIRDTVVEVAKDLLGKPSVRYTNGHPEQGQSPIDGFDCSGFVRFVLTTAGLSIPDYIGLDGVRRQVRHANEFWDYYGVAVHSSLHTSGDIILFSRHGLFPTHVGIVRDEESYIHAPGTDNSTVEIEAITTTDIQARDDECLLYLVNPIGFKAPTVPLELPTYRHHQRPV